MTDVDDGGARQGRLAEVVEAVNAAYPEHVLPCGGLDRCAACRDLWRRLTGGRGVCLVCGRAHWPWEPHGVDAAGEADAAGGVVS